MVAKPVMPPVCAFAFPRQTIKSSMPATARSTNARMAENVLHTVDRSRRCGAAKKRARLRLILPIPVLAALVSLLAIAASRAPLFRRRFAAAYCLNQRQQVIDLEICNGHNPGTADW